jgi:hypothetical protein
LRAILISAATACGLLAGGPAVAQVTFQSAEVLGVQSADNPSAPGALKRYGDRTVRFWSEDGRTFFLDGYGCRYEMAAWPQGLEQDPQSINAVLHSDVENYRKASSGAVSDVGELSSVFVGMLYRRGPGPAGKDNYGLDCSDHKATAIALDVLKTATYRQLRIFVVQADIDEFDAGKPLKKAMAVSFMENTLFRQGDPETLSARAPLAAGLYNALRR